MSPEFDSHGRRSIPRPECSPTEFRNSQSTREGSAHDLSQLYLHDDRETSTNSPATSPRELIKRFSPEDPQGPFRTSDLIEIALLSPNQIFRRNAFLSIRANADSNQDVLDAFTYGLRDPGESIRTYCLAQLAQDQTLVRRGYEVQSKRLITMLSPFLDARDALTFPALEILGSVIYRSASERLVKFINSCSAGSELGEHAWRMLERNNINRAFELAVDKLDCEPASKEFQRALALAKKCGDRAAVYLESALKSNNIRLFSNALKIMSELLVQDSAQLQSAIRERSGLAAKQALKFINSDCPIQEQDALLQNFAGLNEPALAEVLRQQHSFRGVNREET